MGCIHSRPGEEDVVQKFRARKRFMKQAVIQRHAFAMAHCAYLHALRNTGAALRQFAEGEGKDENTPRSTLSSQYVSLPEPPPPPPVLIPSPSRLVQRSSSFPSSLNPEGNASAATVERPSSPNLSASQRKAEDWTSRSTQPNATPPPPSPQKSTWDFFNPFRPSTPPFHQFQEQRGMRPSQDSSVKMYYDGEPIPDLEEECEGEQVVVPWQEKNQELAYMMNIGEGKDLLQIVNEVDDRFLKASAGGTNVSKLLETRKGHFLTEFPDPGKKNGNYHSAKVFSALPWNWAKNPLHAMDENDKINQASEAMGSHALTLERLFAWEKKLFNEVKSGEALRTDHQKKCTLLNYQEVKGEDANAVDKTRSSIKRLHSLILVSFQGVDSTTAAVKRLRDDELYPQLVELVEGLMYMWKIMYECHVHQKQIVLQFKNLDSLVTQEATSEYHHHATVELEKEFNNWYECFCKLVGSHRDYMTALNGWSRLSLMEIENGGDETESMESSRPQKPPTPKIFSLCEEWQKALDRLPDKVASEAIKSFVAVVHALVMQQTEELKRKRRVEDVTKKLMRKAENLANAEKKQLDVPKAAAKLGSQAKRAKRSKKAVDLDSDDERSETTDTDSDSTVGFAGKVVVDPLMGRKATVEALKKKLEDERQEHAKSIQDTRILTMNNLQTGLPGVFEAMTGFSAVCVQALQSVCGNDNNNSNVQFRH